MPARINKSHHLCSKIRLVQFKVVLHNMNIHFANSTIRPPTMRNRLALRRSRAAPIPGSSTSGTLAKGIPVCSPEQGNNTSDGYPSTQTRYLLRYGSE